MLIRTHKFHRSQPPAVAVFGLLCLLLATACSQQNQVQTVTVAELAQPKTADGRFRNLYPGKQQYPASCQTSCYQPQASLQCQQASPANNCSYQGSNPTIAINSGFRVQWLGHASFRIMTAKGQQLLLDPVFQQFDWPVDWAFYLSEGHHRKPPPQLSPAELAATDAVLYSHLHYDHFNKADLNVIGNKAQYLVPLEMAQHFPAMGYQIQQMAWYSQIQLQDLQIVAVPAHHFSNRIWLPFLYDDSGKTSWNGWLIKSADKTLFFAGDTGYSPHFRDIRQKFGAIDVCLLPIASYHHPTDGDWYRYVHTTPEDALTAATELGCKVMIPWGYGNTSWQMGDHSSHSALQRLLTIRQQLQGKAEAQVPLLILNEGEQVQL